MLIRLAICDDSVQIQETIKTYLQEYFNKIPHRVEFHCFNSGDALCENYRIGAYHLIFLDIEMEGRNGIEVSDFIRKEMNDQAVQIVFISGHEFYALALFENRPFNFLIKPIHQEQIHQLMDTFLSLYDLNSSKFQCKVKKTLYQFDLAEIIYFSSDARKVTVHTTDKEVSFYGHLDNIESGLQSPMFLRIHKSYLVNYQHIRVMNFDNVVLSDDTVLHISQAQRLPVRDQFLSLVQKDW
ncbi:MAG: LytTR family DNA-binding domain-containing protein [Lachnospiraceae bacterium]|nr:LytTR family DNA-binding domain-containing protein [Lachnospiraceae bacterium]